MNQDLDALLRAWDAYLQAPNGPEAKRLRALYESKSADIAVDRKVSREVLHRIVERAYQRWQRPDDPKFPRDLRNINLD